MSASQWFCKVMGTELGPLTPEELVEKIRQRQLGPEDLVRRAGGEWTAVFEVKGLLQAAARPAAAEPVVEPEPEPEPAPEPEPIVPQADPTESDWFCLASGERHGPVSFQQLQTLATGGTLRPDDRVWRISRPKFKKAVEVEGLID